VTGYSAALTRASERIEQAYTRLNYCPLGSAALGTSSFAVDRGRLAELLGMNGPIVNSLDATQIAPIDSGAELAGVAISIALTIGAFVADMTTQYAQARPWFTLEEGSLTGVSSIMPQKRNPRGLVMLRAQASTLIGLAQTYFLLAHNVQSGMSDYKAFITEPQNGGNPVTVVRELAVFAANFETLLRTIRFDDKRAREELDSDYAATTELADVLQRTAEIPFRVGHHFASELVNYGRRAGLRPAQIPFQSARTIFTEVARGEKLDKDELPLSEAEFFVTLSAGNMVACSMGIGGPQPAEVDRMVAAERGALAASDAWRESRQAAVRAAEAELDRAFAALRT
jgi:argininosuccinate lyase